MDSARTLNSSGSTFGVFLVSDGGATLASKDDPTIMKNNPNAPINNPEVSQVSVREPTGLTLVASGLVFLFRRKRQ